MMRLLVDGHAFHYEMENLCRVFFPYEKIVTGDGEWPEGEENAVLTALQQEENGARIFVRARVGGVTEEKEEWLTNSRAPSDFEDACERAMAVLLYGLLSRLCAYKPKWGILTGVRPIKLMRRLAAEQGEQKAAAYFERELLVSPEKTALSVQTARAEEKILALSRPESFSLYLSIPFCPTRCAYCSFVSQSVEKAARLIAPYVELLEREIAETGRIARGLGLRLETVYIGGGTPTTLSAEQLGRLLSAVRTHFDCSTLREFTVEAGRPDTITPEKLCAMKAGGVGRISINPQTLNDEVLQTIGRRHSSAQTIEAFHMARAAGSANINMDTIAGLPGDTIESFRSTIERLVALAPESVTVHTLALKRSAGLSQQGGARLESEAQNTDAMLRISQELLSASGYAPYYLYRQSRMLGNLENVGWAKEGYEGLYNVYIMEENHTILACGAGATTKLRQPGGEKIERVFNYKFPYEYNRGFDEILRRKEKIVEFYRQYGSLAAAGR